MQEPTMPRLLYLFTLINLIIGSSAFVTASVLQPLAADLGVGIAAAGQTMTAYAVGTALLAPLLLLATGRWPRKRVLLLALALFTLGNGASALATNLPALLAARVLMGIGGVFTPVAAGIAVALVVPARRGQALSLVFLGMSLSYVIGLPIGSWLGLHHGWRAPVWLACALSAAAFVVVALAVPRDIRAPGASFAGLGRLLQRADVLGVLGMTLLYFGAIFCVFSFIGPVLNALSPMSPTQLSLTLMVFGLAGVVGTIAGGWANDRYGPIRALRFQLTAFVLTMSLVPLTEGHALPMLAAFVSWGLAGFSMMAPQQSRLAMAAPQQAPVLLSLNTSMLYFGMALGAALGGAAAPSIGFARLAWVGAPLALAALGLLLWASSRGAASAAVVPSALSSAQAEHNRAG